MVVFSLTDKDSLEESRTLLSKIVKDGKVKEEATGVILVGNKTDLVRSRHSTLEGQTMINLYLNLHT